MYKKLKIEIRSLFCEGSIMACIAREMTMHFFSVEIMLIPQNDVIERIFVNSILVQWIDFVIKRP
jgi:hypothetical protein